MRKAYWMLILLGLIVVIPFSSFAQEKYWQQFVQYTIDVTLDVEKKALTGTETILYKNNSPDVLHEIYFHLYPNAFKDMNSTVAKESQAQYYSRRIDPKDNGYIDIQEMQIVRRTEGINWQNVPLSAYEVDDTILKAKLPDPLPPGGELMIEMKFFEKIRKFVGRAGYRGNQFDLAQWYPKLVVYDEKGWHPDQMHVSGEFYGEFGTFDVGITLPYNFIVGATGAVVEGDPGWDWVRVDTTLSDEAWAKVYEEQKKVIEERKEKGEMRTVKFHAENVHDFAWLACPDFLYERGEWDGIPVHVLYRTHARQGWSKKVVERGERVLEWLSTKFGRYPYPQLSITHGLLGGGMEYPMLVMNAGPDEGLISHEVGHIYFYGLFANDELADAWMDEGFATFQERWYQETFYGPLGRDRNEYIDRIPWYAKSLPEHTSREYAVQGALLYMNSGFYEPIDRYAHEFKGGYGVNAYTRGSLFFEMLKYIVGDETWDRICHEYFDRWAGKHVNEERFRKVVEDVSGMDMGWYFHQWLHDSVLVDYSLGSVKKSKQADGSWKAEVEIKRKERGVMPVEVEIILPDGKSEIKRWDGRDEKGVLVFQTDSKPKKVILDPSDQVLDNNRLNNGNLRLMIYPDYPRFYYRPRDAYLLRWRPSFWYNDVDGFRLGGLIRGSYQGSYHLSRLGAWYGFKSKEIDFLFDYRNQKAVSNGVFWYGFSGQKMEGRLRGNIGGTFQLANHWYLPPRFNISFGLDYWQLLDGREDYAIRQFDTGDGIGEIVDWQKGIVNKLYLSFNVNPRGLRWDSYFDVRVEGSNKMIGSDFNFIQVSGTAKFRVGSRNGDNVEFRLFGGHTFRGDDPPPVQELFFADGAGPLERFDSYTMRSKGAFPTWMHTHHPGDGNLRGYFNQHNNLLLASEKLVAANIEATKFLRIPLLNRLFSALRMRTAFSGFFDAGIVYDTVNGGSNRLGDAGLGIRLVGRLPVIYRNYTLRFDFPVWLSDPAPGDDNLKFRWLFSFSQAL
ncbi:MAG: M1 family aminopeptidase [bacterium]